MIGKGYHVHDRFFIRMNAADGFHRLVHQFALAIDFDLVFRCFAELADLAIERVGSRQRSEVSLHGVDGKAVVVIPDPPDPDVRQCFEQFERMGFRDKYLELHSGKVLHSYLLSDTHSITRFDQDLPIFKGGLSAQDDPPHPTLDLPAFEGSPAAASELILRSDLVCRVLVHFDVGLRLFGEVEDLARVGDGLLD
jgi:hypothetical protein